MANDLQVAHSLVNAAGRAGWRGILEPPAKAAAALRADEHTVQAAVIDHPVHEEAPYDLVKAIRRARPGLPIIVATATRSGETGANLIRSGATDFICKPLDRDRIVQSLRLATGREAAQGELRHLSEKLGVPNRFEAMVGTDPEFRKALARAAKAARGQRHVIVQGEAGTGKRMLLQAIHAASPRSGFILENLRIRAFPTSAIDSALFGHEAGAFAGAFERKAGALEKSDGGTLIIEEINRLRTESQERLATALARARVQPIGAAHSLLVDSRILATTNQPISLLLKQGNLSPDLHAALDPVTISLPPLRERRSDIPVLARYFLNCVERQLGISELVLTNSALSVLCSFEWPGNIRQLQGVLFRAAIACEGETLKGEYFSNLLSDKQSVPLAQVDTKKGGVELFDESGDLRSLGELEADIIRFAIGHYRGRMSEVARRLGIGRSTLYRKLADLGLEMNP